MRALVFFIGYIIYAYVAINMIIDIENFWDFLWFVFIGTILLGILQFVLVFIASLFDE